MKDNNPQALPKISMEEIFKKSFFYWKSTLIFQFWVSILYFGILLFVGLQLSQYYFGEKMSRFTPALVADSKKFLTQINLLMQTENGGYFQIALALIKAALFPLFIGLFRVYALVDENKKPTFSDLLEGFRGARFFKLWGYAIFWGVVFQLGMSFLLVPGIFWVLITLFVGPLLYFTPMRMMDAIKLSAGVVFANWALIVPCALVALLCSYSGFLVFFIGFLFTYPFWNAMIYSLFKKYFNIKFV